MSLGAQENFINYNLNNKWGNCKYLRKTNDFWTLTRDVIGNTMRAEGCVIASQVGTSMKKSMSKYSKISRKEEGFYAAREKQADIWRDERKPNLHEYFP